MHAGHATLACCSCCGVAGPDGPPLVGVWVINLSFLVKMPMMPELFADFGVSRATSSNARSLHNTDVLLTAK